MNSMITFRLERGNREDFQNFRELQLSVLPDVQQIDQKGFNRLIEKNEIIFCWEKHTNQLAGFAIVKNNGNYGLLRQLAVNKKYRRKGAASKLVETSNQWFKMENLSAFHILVKSHNIPAIKLYKKFGYKIISTIHQYIINWKDFSELGDHSINSSNLRLIKLQETKDEIVSNKYTISINELSSFRELPTSLNLGLFGEKNNLRGFMRLRPHFPVVTPIRLDDPNDIPIALKLVNKYCLDKFDYLRITIQDEKIHEILKKQNYSILNFTLVRMELTI